MKRFTIAALIAIFVVVGLAGYVSAGDSTGDQSSGGKVEAENIREDSGKLVKPRSGNPGEQKSAGDMKEEKENKSGKNKNQQEDDDVFKNL